MSTCRIRAMFGGLAMGAVVIFAPLSSAGQSTLSHFARSQRLLERFLDIELSGERVSDIRCYLTGPPAGDGRFQIARHSIHDKHGLRHTAFNAKMNIHRGGGGPIYLGVQAADLAAFDASTTLISPPPPAAVGAVASDAPRPAAPT